MNLFTKITITTILVCITVVYCGVNRGVSKLESINALKIMDMKVDDNGSHITTTIRTEDGATHVTVRHREKISEFDIENMTIENLKNYLRYKKD